MTSNLRTQPDTPARAWLVAIWLSVLLCVVSLVPAESAGTTYVVAPSGSDSNPGTLELPFRTVQQCVSVAQAGDTCLIRAGVYG
jgi:hypothetical protein